MVDVGYATAEEGVNHPEQGSPKGRHGYEMTTSAYGVQRRVHSVGDMWPLQPMDAATIQYEVHKKRLWVLTVDLQVVEGLSRFSI